MYKQQGGQKVQVSMGTGARWNHKETIALIRLWRTDAVRQLMDGSTRNARAYEILSEKLRQMGYLRSSSQVKERMKRLKREYRQINLQQNGEGKVPSQWPYYNHVKAILESQQYPSATATSTTSNDIDEFAADEDELDEKPYVISTKPDMSAYGIDEPTREDSCDSASAAFDITSVRTMEYGGDLGQYQVTDTPEGLSAEMIPLQEMHGSQQGIRLVYPSTFMASTPATDRSAEDSPDKSPRKKKRTFFKEAMEIVRETQLETSRNLISAIQEMEEKRMKMEMEMEEKRLAAEKEMMHTFLERMASPKPAKTYCHKCQCEMDDK